MAVTSAAERLAEREAEREKRAEELAEKRAARKLQDLDAIEALEQELGDSKIVVIELPYESDDLPVLVAARCPTPVEAKKFQDRLRQKNEGEGPDPIAATREVGASCRKYPDDETWARVLASRPGLLVQLGNEALKLAAGKTRAAGKG